MQAILEVTVPFFALVLAGYLAARQRVLPESAIPGLNAFVLYFALPCMLFRFGAGTPVFDLLNPVVLGVYLAAGLLIVFFTVMVSLNARVQMKDAAFGALVAAFPNTGFMGVPLLVALLGPAAAGPVISTILADLFITSSLCIALAQGASQVQGTVQAPGAAAEEAAAAQGRARQAAWRALRGALSNPLPWAIALGAAFSVLDWRLSGPADVVTRMLADAASPVALFTIGAVLWRAGQHTHTQTALRDYLPVALVKLFLHPLLVFALAMSALALGAPLTAFQVTVLTLAAALPSASNVSLLAERYGADNGRVARIILASTVLAFVSFSALAWLFGVRPG
jgi:predicted permease